MPPSPHMSRLPSASCKSEEDCHPRAVEDTANQSDEDSSTSQLGRYHSLSWGGITFITERTTQALGGWGSRVVQQKTCFAHWGRKPPKRRTRLMREADIHPKRRAQLCDGFSRIDPLPKKECAGRTRLMRKRTYARTKTARTTLRLMSKRIYTQSSASGNGRNGLFVSNQILFSGP